MRSIAKEVAQECKAEIDVELATMRGMLWSPERAEEVAQRVLEKAIPAIKRELITDLKVSVGEATISIGWRAAKIVGTVVIFFALLLSGLKLPWGGNG